MISNPSLRHFSIGNLPSLYVLNLAGQIDQLLGRRTQSVGRLGKVGLNFFRRRRQSPTFFLHARHGKERGRAQGNDVQDGGRLDGIDHDSKRLGTELLACKQWAQNHDLPRLNTCLCRVKMGLISSSSSTRLMGS